VNKIEIIGKLLLINARKYQSFDIDGIGYKLRKMCFQDYPKINDFDFEKWKKTFKII